MSIVNHRIVMILNCQEYLNQNTGSSPERDLSGLAVEYAYSSDPESEPSYTLDRTVCSSVKAIHQRSRVDEERTLLQIL